MQKKYPSSSQEKSKTNESKMNFWRKLSPFPRRKIISESIRESELDNPKIQTESKFSKFKDSVLLASNVNPLESNLIKSPKILLTDSLNTDSIDSDTTESTLADLPSTDVQPIEFGMKELKPIEKSDIFRFHRTNLNMDNKNSNIADMVIILETKTTKYGSRNRGEMEEGNQIKVNPCSHGRVGNDRQVKKKNKNKNKNIPIKKVRDALTRESSLPSSILDDLPSQSVCSLHLEQDQLAPIEKSEKFRYRSERTNSNKTKKKLKKINLKISPNIQCNPTKVNYLFIPKSNIIMSQPKDSMFQKTPVFKVRKKKVRKIKTLAQNKLKPINQKQLNVIKLVKKQPWKTPIKKLIKRKRIQSPKFKIRKLKKQNSPPRQQPTKTEIKLIIKRKIESHTQSKSQSISLKEHQEIQKSEHLKAPKEYENE